MLFFISLVWPGRLLAVTERPEIVARAALGEAVEGGQGESGDGRGGSGAFRGVGGGQRRGGALT